MIIDCISDTHNQHDRLKLPGGDLLIHAGDFSSRGTVEEVEKFLEWFSNQSYEYKVFIAGNHDKSTEKALKHTLKQTAADKGVIYLCDSGVEIEGYNIWGSPWSPKFGHGWAWNAYRNEGEAIVMADGLPWIKDKWDLIPDNIQILITHGPPYSHLDKVIDFTLGYHRSVGCENLAEAVYEIRPSVHIFGHIHESAGISQYGKTTYVNASQLNESYQLVHKPKRIIMVNGSAKPEEEFE